jgi:hypothetical protein
LALASVVVLFVWNAVPQFFPARTHDFVGAFSLAMIAVAYLVYQFARRPPAREFAKVVMPAAAFLFCVPGHHRVAADLAPRILCGDLREVVRAQSVTPAC